MKKIFLTTLCVIAIMTITSVQSGYTQTQMTAWPGVSVNVLKDNDHVKISKMTFAPGATTDWHSHPQFTIYAITDVKMKEEIKDKAPGTIELKAGQAIWFPAVMHKITNDGKSAFTIIVNEIK